MHKQEKHSDGLEQKVDATMALLDMDAPTPANLAATIMAKVENIDMPKVRKLNFMNYIQIAAAVLFGIFIGHKFGQIANDQVPQRKQDPMSQYFKAHHFNIENTNLNSPSLYLKN